MKNLTPKQEAERIESLFGMPMDLMTDERKACALIHIGGCIEQFEEVFHTYGLGFMGRSESKNDYTKHKHWQWLKEVEQEIEKL